MPPSLKGRMGSALVGIVTIVAEELDAAAELFGTADNIEGSPYWVQGRRGDSVYPMVLRKAADRGNLACGEAARDLIEDFRPCFLLLVGIAGGVAGRDGTALGDVIVADFIEYSEMRKLEAGSSRPRHIPYDHPSIFLRENFAEPVARKSQWQQRIHVARPEQGESCVRIGHIVAGEKLYADPASSVQKDLVAEYDKALAVEMEAMGFARAVCKLRKSAHYNPQYLVIRGVSDMVNDETASNDETRRNWRPYAAAAAAAFALELAAAIERTHKRLKYSGE